MGTRFTSAMVLGAVVAFAAMTNSVSARNGAFIGMAQNSGAICGAFDEDGVASVVIFDNIMWVIAPNGAATLRCTTSGVANSTGKTIKFDAGDISTGCAIPNQQANGPHAVTQNWHQTITPDGRLTLVCITRPAQ